MSSATGASIRPVSPPSTNTKKKPREKRRGVFRTGFPPQSVAIQQKIWMPDGIAIIMLAAVKSLAHEWQAGSEHVMYPEAEADEGRRDERENEREIAEDTAARERSDDG